MKIGLSQIKQALRDPRFRDSLPIELQDEIVKYLHNPGCLCNIPFYRKILKTCKEHVKKYFPGKEITNEEEEIRNMAKNHWMVINCHIDELEKKLRKLPPGRKQLDVARHEDQVTVVINELDVIF